MIDVKIISIMLAKIIAIIILAIIIKIVITGNQFKNHVLDDFRDDMEIILNTIPMERKWFC